MDNNIYESTKTELNDLVINTNVRKLKDLHRKLEVFNANAIINTKKEDNVLKDIEFLLKSAIILNDVSKSNDDDVLFQLEAALNILNNSDTSPQLTTSI
jgi:hypothetical protein